MVLWLGAAVLKGISPQVDQCQAIFEQKGLFFTYPEYLGLAGILVICLFIGLVACGFCAFGCSSSSLPSVVKIISGLCVIIPVAVLIFYLGMLALGTVMVIFCPRQASAIIYIGMLYAYGLVLLLCGVIAFIVIIKKIGKVADRKLSTALKK